MTGIIELITENFETYNLWQYVNTAIFILFLLFALRILKSIFKIIYSKNIKKSEDNNSFFVEIIEEIKVYLIFFICLYFITYILELDESIKRIFYVISNGAFILQIILIFQTVVRVVIRKIISKDDYIPSEHRTIYEYSKKFIGIIIWLVAIILFLSNIGYNVTSLVTGLGIGGIAVALAVQNILKDVLSGVTILMNKPIQVGDYIKLENSMSGTVEKIGLRNTTLRMIGKEELIVPNDKILNSTIVNYRSRTKRRVEIVLEIDMDTKSSKLRTLETSISKLIKKEELVEEDSCRINFDSIGKSALIFKIVYIIKNTDFDAYVDISQRLNFAIKEIFEKNKIEFAKSSNQVQTT